ncbi:hypothetical protein a10_08682 [Streptomyces acidiscabies]|nr:hypothetical protein a10_08682 [Streptomyces acidiscabies]GAV45773.1 hypothetical protein Saa2_08765 [Streptomyces acidiscabies]
MRLLDDLQRGLTTRYNQIATSRRSSFGREVQYAACWIRKQSPLMAIIDEARHVEELPPLEEWLRQCANNDGVLWPTETEEGRAVLSCALRP